MINKEDLIVTIRKAQGLLNNMIHKAEKSGGYFQGLYSFRDLLGELITRVESNKSLNDDDFLKKWSSIYGHAHRYFEAHPLLDILFEIDDAISKNNNT